MTPVAIAQLGDTTNTSTHSCSSHCDDKEANTRDENNDKSVDTANSANASCDNTQVNTANTANTSHDDTQVHVTNTANDEAQVNTANASHDDTQADAANITYASCDDTQADAANTSADDGKVDAADRGANTVGRGTVFFSAIFFSLLITDHPHYLSFTLVRGEGNFLITCYSSYIIYYPSCNFPGCGQQ